MFDCSKELTDFYLNHVVLPIDKKRELQEKRRLNIKRVKSGLKKYNDKNGTDYSIVEDLIQGSVAMSTIVQNDSNDYDIDVGIAFDEDDLDLTPSKVRNIISESLDSEMYQFSEPSEVKTSCVRVNYSTGYHIDFAVYKRNKQYEWQDYKYIHAGAEWKERDIRGIEKWFDEKRKEKEYLRKVVRCLKMFCNSRNRWIMPIGLVQTILCEEVLDEKSDRLDTVFYETLKSIVTRLSFDLSVNAPVDNNRSLITRNKDRDALKNLKNRLEQHLKQLDVLFNEYCTYEEAMEAWGNFFNHKYWTECLKEPKVKRSIKFDNTEEFIQHKHDMDIQYSLSINCDVQGNGWRKQPLLDFLNKTRKFERFIPYNFKVECEIGYTDCLEYDKILWKVRNVGQVAESKNMIRGQINEGGMKITEPTSFRGNHYIECYLIKNDRCVAKDRVNIPIGGI